MRINQVEEMVGISKKNIRFYEEKGLLMPKRTVENGYRDYCEEDVQRLQQIKLLRKLGVSIEEIRQMLNGNHTVGDGMRRHLITLERERQNLDQSITFCRNLQNMNMPLGNNHTFGYGEFTVSVYKSQTGRACNATAVSQRCLDAKGHTIGLTQLHLACLPFGTENCYLFQPALWGDQSHPFPRYKLARL